MLLISKNIDQLAATADKAAKDVKKGIDDVQKSLPK